jgi:cytoskeleton protein RodZ
VDTLGHELRRRREELNIELRDVAEATRVGVRFLHAIEADDFSALPGGIYARSFIRSYAKHIGMDEEEAVNRYRKQTNQIEDQMNEPQPQRDFPSEPSQFSVGLVVVGLLAVIGVGGFAAARYFSNSTAVSPAVTQPVNATGATAANNPPVATPQQPSATSPTAQQASLTNPPQTGATAPATGDGTIQQAVQNSDNMVLTFVGIGECWLSVSPDEKPLSKEGLTIQAGQTQEFKASSKFKVTVGNLQNVKILINGQPVKLPSANGLLASNVLISKENYQQYVAAASNPNAKLPKPEVKRPKPTTETGAPTTPAKPASSPATGTTDTPAVKKPNPTATTGTTGTTGNSSAPTVKPPSSTKPAGTTVKPTTSTEEEKPKTEKPKTETKPDNQ